MQNKQEGNVLINLCRGEGEEHGAHIDLRARPPQVKILCGVSPFIIEDESNINKEWRCSRAVALAGEFATLKEEVARLE